MFCEKCGKQLNEGAAFCDGCGAKIENVNNAESQQPVANAQQPTANTQQSVANNAASQQSGANYQTAAPVMEQAEAAPTDFMEAAPAKVAKKFAFNKLYLIAAGIIVVCVALIVAFFPNLKNSAIKLTSSPEKYLSHVIENTSETPVKTLASTVGTLKNISENGAAEKGSVKVKVEDSLTGIIEDISGEDLSEYIEWFKEAEIGFDSNTKDLAMSTKFDVNLNKKDIGAVEYYLNAKDESMYIGVPDYNKEYLMTEEIGSNGELAKSMEEMYELYAALPDEKVLEKVMTDYILCIVQSVDDVKESKTKLTSQGITQKVTKLSFDVDGDMILDAAENVLNKAKDDKDLKKIIDGMSDVTDVDYDDFKEMVEEALDSLKDADPDEFGKAVKFNIYVNSVGEFVGADASRYATTVSCYDLVKGGKFGTTIKYEDESVKLTVEGSGKESGGKRTGKFAVKFGGVDLIEFDAKKLDVEKLAEGIFDGEITVKPCGSIGLALQSEGVPKEVTDEIEKVSLKLVSKSTSVDKVDCEVTVNYDDKTVAVMNLNSTLSNGSKVKFPGKYVEIEDGEEAEDWARAVDADKFFKKLRDAKVPSEFVDQMEEGYEDSF